jgi:hypothetical protein
VSATDASRAAAEAVTTCHLNPMPIDIDVDDAIRVLRDDDGFNTAGAVGRSVVQDQRPRVVAHAHGIHDVLVTVDEYSVTVGRAMNFDRVRLVANVELELHRDTLPTPSMRA